VTATTTGSKLRVERIPAKRVGEAKGLLDRAHGAVITGVIPAKMAARVAQKIADGALGESADKRDRADDRPQVHVHGVAISPSDLHPTGPTPAPYFAAADAFRARLEQLFAPDPGPFERLTKILTALGAPALRQAAPYGSATVRICPPGVGMTIHCENVYLDIPVNDRLRTIVDLPRQWSWVFLLREPDGGGEIELTNLSLRERGMIVPPDFPEQGGDFDRALLAQRPGDLALLASGDLHHRVLAPRGGDRITLGGFFAPARDANALCYWG
jgi:hypothetical protein